jgi:hypothetical protein
MDIVIIVLISLQFLAVCFIVLLAKSYLPKYIAKRAENLATKEDIGEITRITEEAKKSYIHEVERLRSDLIILREEITLVRTRGDKALIDFFENCNALLSKFYAFPNMVSVAVREDIDEFCDTVGRLYNNVRRSQKCLPVYFHGDEKLVKQSIKVVSACTKLLCAFDEYFPPLASAFEKQKKAYIKEDDEEYNLLADVVDQKVREYDEAIKPPMNKLYSEFDEYSNGMAAYFRSKYQNS